jgi:hypothetical protein
MSKLQNTNKTKAMGIHFSGLGFSILVSDLLMRSVFTYSENWQHAWFSDCGVIIRLPFSLYSQFGQTKC